MLSIAGGLLLGLLVGSFLNVVIYRLPVMMEREWRQQCNELLADAEEYGDERRSPLKEREADIERRLEGLEGRHQAAHVLLCQGSRRCHGGRRYGRHLQSRRFCSLLACWRMVGAALP